MDKDVAARRPLGAPANFNTPAGNRFSPAVLVASIRRNRTAALLLSATAVLVAAIVPGFGQSQLTGAADAVSLPIVLPTPSPVASQRNARPTSGANTVDWRVERIRAGQTLGELFAELGLSGTELHRLLDHPGARTPLTRIRPGDEFAFDIGADGHLRALRFDRSETERVTLQLDSADIGEIVLQRPLQHRVQIASGVIDESLFAAGAKAGMSSDAIFELAKAFGYDIDFAQDLRDGDRFDVAYEELWQDGERVRAGDILAATFVNQGKRYQVFRYVFADGRREYYDADGRPMKKSFLRMPIEFARISSRFSNARRHPVLGTIRAHQGVDYASGSGTPIMAAGDGRIAYAGWKGGYGRAVILDHGGGVTTLYGHMSRLGNHRIGSRVRQGDVIGFVGASGLATGPHLHYEFRMAGVHRDPLRVTLPKPQPLPNSELNRFRLQTQPMLAQLRLLEAGRAFARR